MTNYLKARPRLVISVLISCALMFALPTKWRDTTRLLVSWDVGMGLYITLVAWMMARSDIKTISRRAAAQDEGATVMLALTTLAALASLAAIIAELAKAKGVSGHLEWEHIALCGATVFLSWTFMQTIFALHYAHEYYMMENGIMVKGLEFPGNEAPDYWDFAYFSFVIGTAAQTADVNISCKSIRRIAALHCAVVFFFNTTILALTVNIGAGLF